MENKTFQKNFANSVQLSGLVATKPLFGEIKRSNGQVSEYGSFILVQNFVGHGGYQGHKKFICQTHSPQVIAKLKKYNKQIYITCLGKLDYYWDDARNKPIYYPLIEEINIESICPEELGS